VSAAVFVSNGEGDSDDVKVPEREHVLASKRRLPGRRKNRQDLLSPSETGQVSFQVYLWRRPGPNPIKKIPE